MKNIKKMMVYLLAIIVSISVNGTLVNAAENKEVTEQHYVVGYIFPSSTYSFDEDGLVWADGLRLRTEPNTNSTILELMYFGEEVLINLDKSTMTFYYVKRVKTGTKGYANAQYIQLAQGGIV